MYAVGRLPFESMENDRGEMCALKIQTLQRPWPKPGGGGGGGSPR